MPTFTDPKAGDIVAIRRRPGSIIGTKRCPYFRAVVKRVTATQILVGNAEHAPNAEWRFRREDGNEVGSGYDRVWAVPWTAEIEAEIQRYDEQQRIAEQRSDLGRRLHAVAHKIASSAEVQADAATVERFAALVAAAEVALTGATSDGA